MCIVTVVGAGGQQVGGEEGTAMIFNLHPFINYHVAILIRLFINEHSAILL